MNEPKYKIGDTRVCKINSMRHVGIIELIGSQYTLGKHEYIYLMKLDGFTESADVKESEICEGVRQYTPKELKCK